jgi:hypothetical protein
VAEFAVPAFEGEVAFQSGRTNVKAGFDVGAIEPLVVDGGRAVVCAGEVGILAERVTRLAQGDFGNDAQPAAESGRERCG